MVELGHKELSGRVIEEAITVHRALGPGFIESVYEKASWVELASRGISYEQQERVPVLYPKTEVGLHRWDLAVEGIRSAELKAVKAIEDIFFAIERSQMCAAGLSDGLILNFAALPLVIKRIDPGLSGS